MWLDELDADAQQRMTEHQHALDSAALRELEQSLQTPSPEQKQPPD